MPKLKPAVGAEDHRTGNTQAHITLVEYGDFECPHCGIAHRQLRRLLDEMGDSFQLVFRNFPLQEIHPHAHMAALAAEAAAGQGKYWEMHDLIFENQDRLGGHFLLDLAGELDLDMQRFAKDWKSERAIAKVEKDFESGVRSGVNGTPSFFINGELWLGYDETFESLKDAIASVAGR